MLPCLEECQGNSRVCYETDSRWTLQEVLDFFPTFTAIKAFGDSGEDSSLLTQAIGKQDLGGLMDSNLLWAILGGGFTGDRYSSLGENPEFAQTLGGQFGHISQSLKSPCPFGTVWPQTTDVFAKVHQDIDVSLSINRILVIATRSRQNVHPVAGI